MKSVIELEVARPRERVASLMADPTLNTQWMDDIERIDPVRGDLGMPGSAYRIVPKRGSMIFIATVISADPLNTLHLSLDSAHISVDVRATFRPIGPGRTMLVSEETFTFKGFLHRILGMFARPAIKKAHRRHIEAFKRFAEAQA